MATRTLACSCGGRRAFRAGALALTLAAGARLAFVGGAARSVTAPRGAVPLQAEASPAPAPAPTSVALVKVTEESTNTTAGILGGAIGLLTGGVWVGAALFAASSYLTRKDNDVGTVLKGASTTALEAINFGAYLNDKYSVTAGVGDAFNDVLSKNPDAKAKVSDVFDGVTEAYVSVDKDVGIKDTVGTILTSGSELASQAVEKVFEINEKYKVTDTITEKVTEVIEKAQSNVKKA